MTHYRKYFFGALLSVAIALGVLLMWPFLTTLVMGIALSVVFHPVYVWLKKRVKWPALASGLTVLLFLIILCVPIAALTGVVFSQIQGIYTWLSDHNTLGVLMERTNEFLGHIVPAGTINMEEKIAGTLSQVASGATAALTATLSTVFSLLLVILIMFYFLKDGPQWKKMVIEASPLSDGNDEKIINRLRSAINGVFKGHLFVGLAQGAAMGLGLFIFGVPNAALWGVFAGIASMIPSIGTALVSVPSVIFLFATGQDGAAIGLIVWALLLVGFLDNFLNPLVVGKQTQVHPLLILFSVLGGIALMGPIGILIGPLIISFIYALTSVYKSEMS